MDQSAAAPSSGPFDIDEKILTLMRGKRIAVPPYPAVALRLHEVTSRPSFAITDVVDVVQNDQALMASVLRAANTVLFSAMGAATTLQQAISRLGASEVSRVALAAGLSESMKTPGGLQALRRQAWAEGVASAAVSHALARLRGLSQRDAFTCGLLHDFGRIVGIAALEQILSANPSVAARPEESWRMSLARVVPEVASLVAATWNLPPLLQQAMTLRTPRSWSKSAYAPLLEVVAASDEVIGLMMRLPHVGAVELSGLASLKPGEPEPLAEMLPGIPQTIASFEAEPAPKPAPTKVTPPATSLGNEPQRPLKLMLNQLQPQRRGPFQMVSINNTGWLMQGELALPERQMFEVTIALPSATGAGAPQFKLWASTTLSVQEGARYRIECKPFALDREGKKRWADLVASAKPVASRSRFSQPGTWLTIALASSTLRAPCAPTT